MVSVRGERGQVEWKGPVAWSRAIRRITCCDGGDPAVWFTHSAYRAVRASSPTGCGGRRHSAVASTAGPGWGRLLIAGYFLMACPVPQTEQGIRRGGVALVSIVLGRVGT
jgi:hypothetical protein